MPRPTDRPLMGPAAVLAELAEFDVTDAPVPPPDVPERRVGSVLAFALFFAQRHKGLEFPEPFDWDRPTFFVVDAKLRVRVDWAELDGFADLKSVLAEASKRAKDAAEPVVLALDAFDAEAPEFRYQHALYGEVMMLAFRVRAPRRRDPRIGAAQEAGWTETLKDNNLLPGRSLFIPDDQVGLFLTDPALAELAGVHVLLPNGHFSLKLNPFLKAERNDPDLQYWLAWGRGGAASQWQDVLMVHDDDAQ